MNSDVFFHPNIFDKLHLSSNDFLLVIENLKRLGEEEMKVITEGPRVIKISKSIPPERAHGEYIGIAKIPKKALKVLKDCTEEVMEEKGAGVFYEDAIQRMIDLGYPVYYLSTEGSPWIEVDFPQELLIAERLHRNFKNFNSY